MTLCDFLSCHKIFLAFLLLKLFFESKQSMFVASYFLFQTVDFKLELIFLKLDSQNILVFRFESHFHFFILLAHLCEQLRMHGISAYIQSFIRRLWLMIQYKLYWGSIRIRRLSLHRLEQGLVVRLESCNEVHTLMVICFNHIEILS